MTHRRAHVLTVLLAIACRREEPPGVMDASRSDTAVADATRDTSAMDAADAPVSPDVSDVTDVTDVNDVLSTDRQDVVEVAIDGGFDDPCTRLVDLNARGTRVGATTTITLSNADTATRATLDAPCAMGMTGHVVAFRYVASARGRLRISTNHEGTVARLDTVVFALASCVPAARSLGCGDDTGDPPRDHASTFVTDEIVEAGQSVTIAVGGFLHASRELWDSQGTFTLTVTEQ